MESGTIVLPEKAAKQLRSALQAATNVLHDAVMFEIQTMAQGLDSGELSLLASRVSAARERWSSATAPDQQLLINLVAVRAVEEHVDACGATGRLRAIRPTVLDELLPRRNGKDVYFRIPDRHGDLPAGITIDDGELRWYAESTELEPAKSARSTPLAKVAFGLLSRMQLPAGMGGEITDSVGRVVLRFAD